MKPRAYLDIETDWQKRITIIGVYRPGADTQQWVRPDLSADGLREFLQGIETLYTYNGARFDLPVLRDQLDIDLAKEYRHHDLMYDCWSRCLFGGLKKVEKRLGITRDTEGLDGRDAVLLWDRYVKGEKDLLELLLRYNREDVINLEALAVTLGLVPREEGELPAGFRVPEVKGRDDSGDCIES
ncbi:MAG TPA: ribonuclease H-like domain-containing protein [Elusimicrobiota bacterium]|nr:ribonuclease H-like domain-containing protein [Elusimicrobiota bacterium]